MSGVDDAVVWLAQARSDARAAEALRAMRARLGGFSEADVGCHVALLCAQSVEKSIKACMTLVGMNAPLTHNVEGVIDALLQAADGRRDTRPERRLRAVFDGRGVRTVVVTLLAWVPGNASSTDPNYEYPWMDGGALVAPTGHALFGGAAEHAAWGRVAADLADGAAEIAEALLRAR